MDGGKQMDCKVLLVSFVTFHSYGPFRSPTLSQKYRIGNLSPEDAKKAADFQFGDMYETDPIRDPNNLGCTVKPWCGEPRIDLLTRDYITPNELFYVRNHLAVPDIEPEDYELVIKGKGIKKHKFTLEDLKTKFPKHEVVTTLQCAGNRREDMHDDDHKIFIAPHWVVGAMSTAKWGGVKIRDVLKYCGLDVDGMALGTNNPSDIKHVQFEGYDTDETGLCYGGSIPIDKAVDGLGDAIFAFEMNGEPLPRDHGYPVRAIAPGHAGARQCKWLHKVILSDKESQKSWQQKSYRGFAPDITFEGDLADWPPPRLDQAPIVQEMPVQSLVCNPPQNSLLGMKGATDITVKGVAWSGGGRKVERVDVSIDGGKTWTAAELYKPIEQRRNRHWAWTQFSKTLPLPEHVRKRLEKGEQVSLDITSKAMNSDFNVQVCSVVSSYSSGLGLQRPVPYSQSTNYVVSLTP
jgi:sulfite oxidase